MKDSIIITSKKYNSIEFYKSKTNFKKAEKYIDKRADKWEINASKFSDDCSVAQR